MKKIIAIIVGILLTIGVSWFVVPDNIKNNVRELIFGQPPMITELLPEDIDVRTYTSKTFEINEGKRVIEAHVGQIHYKKAGKLEDIDNHLTAEVNGWRMDKASYHAFLPRYADEWFEFRNVYKEETDFTVRFRPVVNHSEGILTTTGEQANVEVVYLNVLPDIDMIVRTGKNSLQREFRINVNPNQDLKIQIEIDTLKEIEADGKKQDKTKKLKVKKIKIKDGKHFTEIRKPRAWDSDKQLDIEFLLEDGKITKLIPKTFLDNANYPVFTDDVASFYVGAGDGRTQALPDANWDTVHNAANGDNADATGTTISVFTGLNPGDSKYGCNRLFFPTDTSGINSGNEVTSASFYFYIETLYDEIDSYMNVTQSTQPDHTTVATTDYTKAGDVHTPTVGAADLDLSITSNSYNEISLNSTGRGWIKVSGASATCGTDTSETGLTCLAVRFGGDIDDVALSDRTGFIVRMSEYANTTSDPYLKIEYASTSDAVIEDLPPINILE